jgi:FAD/FMN-containing dehydrogenase
MASLLGAKGIFSMFKLFLPEILMIAKIGFPKLIVLAEFTSQSQDEIKEKIQKAKEIIKKYKYLFRQPKDEKETEKYWRLRRDTYKLLREKIKNLTAAPFIDDFIILPEYLPEFLPKLYQILDEYKLIYTISGHLGDGNLHIIPLMDLKNENQRKNILEITDKVYDLVLSYKGILTAEHNDGLIRGPYLEKEFGKEVYEIFLEIKKIFDPQNIFNPYKKVMARKENIEKFIIK